VCIMSFDVEKIKNEMKKNDLMRYLLQKNDKLHPYLRKIVICYILAIFTFGIIYFVIYRIDTNSFLINEKIHEARNQDSKAELDKKVDILKKQLGALEDYKKEYDEFVQRNPEWNTSSPPNLFKSNADLKPGEVIIMSSRLENRFDFYRWDGEKWKKWKSEPKPKLFLSGYDLLDIRERIAEIKPELEALTTKRLKLEKKEISPWEFLDFIYFSLLTQTTISYGDIVPNNRLVRGVVSTQVMISLYLLVILINNYAMKKNSQTSGQR